MIVAIPIKQVTTSKRITPGKPKNEYIKAPPIGPIRTEMASALSNKAETFVTSCFYTTSPKKALQVVQCAISKIPKAKANGIKRGKVKISLSAR